MSLIETPLYTFIFAKIKQYTYKSYCFKYISYVHKGPKTNTKLYITCVQMFGNAKIWP